MKLPSKTTTINKNDKLSREINRRKKTCERCGRGKPYQMHWCHVYGRRAKNLRWDSLNHLLLCSVCHRWNHEYPTEFTEWFKEKYPGRHEALQKKYNQVKTMTIHDYLKIQEGLKKELKGGGNYE